MNHEIFINEIADPQIREDAQMVLIPIRDIEGQEFLLEIPISGVEFINAELSKLLKAASIVYNAQPKSQSGNEIYFSCVGSSRHRCFVSRG